jgi:hypothetical protein
MTRHLVLRIVVRWLRASPARLGAAAAPHDPGPLLQLHAVEAPLTSDRES